MLTVGFACCKDLGVKLIPGPRFTAALILALTASGCGASSPNRLTEATQVIGAWSRALRHGELRTAADYFALPSLFVNGAGGGAEVITIHTAAQARLVNETLPCGARLISVRRDGRFFNGQFLLTGRPGPGGSDCVPGAGETAHVDFEISHGKISAWIRAPSAAGPAAPIPAPAQPGGTPLAS